MLALQLRGKHDSLHSVHKVRNAHNLSGVPAEAPTAARVASYARAAAGDARTQSATSFPQPAGMCLPHQPAASDAVYSD